jgi:branched-chain amino acid transport system permease protein
MGPETSPRSAWPRSSSVVGAFVVTVAYEGPRGIEGLLNESKVMAEPVIGLTEIVLTLAMIAVLALRPGGIFPTREIGTLLTRRKTTKEKPG